LKQIVKKINWIAVLQFVFAVALVAGPAALANAGSLPGGGSNGICSKLNGLNCNNVTDVNSLILTVINWILGITLAIDVLFMIFGGFLYITSAGNEDRAKKGKNTVVNAIIGLVIIILAYFLANVVANYFSNVGATTGV
jgi:hypothetical protein